MKSSRPITSVLALLLSLALAITAYAAKKPNSGSETLHQYVLDLKKNPSNRAVREKIIKLAESMKQRPELPESAERNMARGAAYFSKASELSGYKKAINEFEAASNEAPWFALAYYNLGVAQEKAGLYAESIQSLKFYLLAAPEARNAREVKNKIYELEVDAEDAQAGKNAPPAKATAPEPGGAKSLALAGAPELDIAQDKALRIIKMPRDKKVTVPNFAGDWCFKEAIRGEDITIHAFMLSKNANGDLVVTPPKRAADSVATVNIFEISGNNLKLQMKWKMKSVVGYWKTETYVLTLSADGSQLTGTHNQQSVGGRNIDMDRVLFRQ